MYSNDNVFTLNYKGHMFAMINTFKTINILTSIIITWGCTMLAMTVKTLGLVIKNI